MLATNVAECIEEDVSVQLLQREEPEMSDIGTPSSDADLHERENISNQFASVLGHFYACMVTDEIVSCKKCACNLAISSSAFYQRIYFPNQEN